MITTARRISKVLLVIGAILVSLFVGLSLLSVAVNHALRESLLKQSQVTEPETGYVFPVTADIARITVKNCRYRDGTSFPEFDIPENCWSEVIGALSPSQYDPRPASWVVLGGMVVQLKHGEQCSIDLFYVGPDPRFPDIVPVGAFSAGPTFESRKYYRGGNEANLKAALIHAYAEYQKKLGKPGT